MKLIRHLPRFRHADRVLASLAERESWNREQIDSFQLRAINELWAHASGSVPYYENLRAKQKLPSKFQSLCEFRDRVPLLSKDSVRENPDAFLSRIKFPGFWCRTGGSTGTPMRVFWNNDAHHEMLCTKYRGLQMFGIDYFAPTAYLWGHSTYFQPGLKGRIARLRQPVEDFCRNRLRLSAYCVAPHDLRDYLERMRRFRPVVLYGYPSAIRLLAIEAKKTTSRIESLRHIIATGEPVDKEAISEIEQAFSAPVVTEYGSVDCGHIAHHWPDGTLRVREDVQFVETVRQDSLSNGIVVTPLRNFAYPLLRYDLGDTSTAPLHRSEQGFSVLNDVRGRNNDLLLGRDGGVAHSARIDAMFKYQCKNIRRFQVHQKICGEVDVFVELHQSHGSHDIREHIVRLFVELIGFPTNVHIVDQIQLSQAGKHRLVVSDLARKTFEQLTPS
jgi:phenylacetate-CoA ligase